jgi:radical SAM enzyme (TIGR01210 family)
VGDSAIMREDVEKKATLEKRLSRFVRSFRPASAREMYDSANPFPALYYEECMFEGRPYILPMIVLRTSPCNWYMKTGGCMTCGYQGIAQLEGTGDDDILAQVDAAFQHLRLKGGLPFLHLTSSGSFFNQREISDAVMIAIAQRMETEGVRVFSTESRAEVVTNRDRLALFRKHYSGTVSVGIGLESMDENVRNLCFFKGVRNQTLERAISTLRDFDMDFHAYILIGKPFLTPEEDVEDAFVSVRYAIEKGGEALLMVANIQLDTPLYALWKKGLYKLPSLWAPIKVLRKLEPKLRSRVAVKGLDKAVPSPHVFQQTCNLCTPVVRNALVGFNWTKDFLMIDQAWNCCSCRKEWEKTLEIRDERPIRQRIESALEQFKY